MTQYIQQSAPGPRSPTEKQVKFAKAIAAELAIELPAVKTRQSLFLYIRDNRPKYDELMRLRREGRAKLARMRRKWDNPDPDPIDPDEDWYQMTGEGLDPATGGFDDNY